MVFVEAMMAMCKSRLKEPDRAKEEREWEECLFPPVLGLQGQVDFAGFTNEGPGWSRSWLLSREEARKREAEILIVAIWAT